MPSSDSSHQPMLAKAAETDVMSSSFHPSFLASAQEVPSGSGPPGTFRACKSQQTRDMHDVCASHQMKITRSVCSPCLHASVPWSLRFLGSRIDGVQALHQGRVAVVVRTVPVHWTDTLRSASTPQQPLLLPP